MPALIVPKAYRDGVVLFEADLDDIKEALETLLNTTKLDSDNIRAESLTGTVFADGAVEGTAVQFTSEKKLTLDTTSITASKFHEDAFEIPIGGIKMFYSYNGAVEPDPLKWELLSDYNDLYIEGQNSATTINSVFRLGTFLSALQHNHQWYDYVSNSAAAKVWKGGAEQNIARNTSECTSPTMFVIDNTITGAQILNQDAYTDMTSGLGFDFSRTPVALGIKLYRRIA